MKGCYGNSPDNFCVESSIINKIGTGHAAGHTQAHGLAAHCLAAHCLALRGCHTTGEAKPDVTGWLPGMEALRVVSPLILWFGSLGLRYRRL
jgi:hypothetical protein